MGIEHTEKKIDRYEKEMIPGREECLALIRRYGMPENILRHSLEVAKVALFLSAELNKKGKSLDLQLVEAASLLHDLGKKECFKTGEDHAQKGFEILSGMGFKRVGEVVGEHIHLSGGKGPSGISEEEIVNYSDKRVKHDQVVSLSERFIDLKERYGKNIHDVDRIEKIEKKIFELEQKIFSILNIDPDHLLFQENQEK